MKYQIEKQPSGIEIEVSEISGKERLVLEAFRECKEGRCTCPTQEYEKLDSLEIHESAGTIYLRLRAKQGAEFDRGEIQRCLEHTEEHVKSRK